MKKEELDKIVSLHELWVSSEVNEGIRANLRRADLAGANLYKANLSGVNLVEADLIGADLMEANLTRADLIEANLTRANLKGVDLGGANLTGVELMGAALEGTNIFSFQLNRHFGFYHVSNAYDEGNLVKIGCESHSLDWWLDNYKEMGKEAHYSDKEIRNYGRQLKTLKEME